VLANLIPIVFVRYIVEHIVFKLLQLQASFEIDTIPSITLKEVHTALSPASVCYTFSVNCTNLLLRECY
jgi:hypothetical protein